MKDWLRDYLDQKEQAMHSRILSSSTNLVIIGVLLGVAVANTSIVPLTTGFALGYAAAKNKTVSSLLVVPDERLILGALGSVLKLLRKET